jgi:hypothetical protein
MKALLICGLVLGMVFADSLSSLSQVRLLRYAVCAKVKVIKGIRVIKCAKRPTPLADPTENLETVCGGVVPSSTLTKKQFNGCSQLQLIR